MDEEPTGGLEPEDRQPNHVLVVALRIVLVALVVVLGIVFTGKFLVSKLGLDDASTVTTSAGPVPVEPIDEPTPSSSPSPQDAQTLSTSDLPSLSAPPAPTDIPSSDPVPPGLRMSISPATVHVGQTFTVTGTYAGRDGVQVQLQRLENGVWADYPNDVTVTMGTYSTSASSTLQGTNSFRVYDQTTGRASNVVSIFVR